MIHRPAVARLTQSFRLSAAALAVTSPILLAFAPQAAYADPSPALDRASVSIGAFYAKPTFRAGVDTNFGRLDTGEVERSNVTMPRIKADVLLFDSQGLSFDYFQYKRDYGGTLASNFNTGSGTVTTTGAANVNVKFDLAKLAYKWWLGSGDTVLGLGAGAAYYRASFDARATASVGATTGAISDSYSDSAFAPLLEIGVRHALTDNVRLFADASGIRKNGGSVNGSIYNAALGVEWFPWKNVGVVLDYGMTDIELKRPTGSNAQIKVRLEGPSAYLKVRF